MEAPPLSMEFHPKENNKIGVTFMEQSSCLVLFLADFFFFLSLSIFFWLRCISP